MMKFQQGRGQFLTFQEGPAGGTVGQPLAEVFYVGIEINGAARFFHYAQIVEENRCATTAGNNIIILFVLNNVK